MITGYQGRRGRPSPSEIQIRRDHRQNNIAHALQGPAGQLIGVLASLAPGPAGMALRTILGIFDSLREREALEADREFKASIVSLRKAVDALLAMQEEADAETKPETPAPEAIKATPIEAPAETPPEPPIADPAPNPLDALLKRLRSDPPAT